MNPAPASYIDWPYWVYTASWRGRIGRMPYLARRVGIVLALLGLVLVLMLAGFLGHAVFVLALILAVPVYLTITFRSVTLDIQRLHDLNLSGWWLLLVVALGLVPSPGTHFAGFILYWATALFVPGTPGPNRFDDPTLKPRMPWQKPAFTPTQPAVRETQTPQPEAEEAVPPKPAAKPKAKKAAAKTKKPIAGKAPKAQKPRQTTSRKTVNKKR